MYQIFIVKECNYLKPKEKGFEFQNELNWQVELLASFQRKRERVATHNVCDWPGRLITWKGNNPSSSKRKNQ